jgi:hypothetical protein
MDLEQSNPEQPGAVGNEGVILLEDGETESDEDEEPETIIKRCRVEKSALPAVVSAAEYAVQRHFHDVLLESEVLARPQELARVSADATKPHTHDTRSPKEGKNRDNAKIDMYNRRMRRVRKAEKRLRFEDMQRQLGADQAKKQRLN